MTIVWCHRKEGRVLYTRMLSRSEERRGGIIEELMSITQAVIDLHVTHNNIWVFWLLSAICNNILKMLESALRAK
jgi:hypothetical protein